MLNGAGSAVKPKKITSISDPDWGNRITMGPSDKANCCVEYNTRFGYVIRAVNDLEVDETLILFDQVCSPMYVDEHIEAKREWLMGEKTMVQMDNAVHVNLDDLARKDKFVAECVYGAPA